MTKSESKLDRMVDAALQGDTSSSPGSETNVTPAEREAEATS